METVRNIVFAEIVKEFGRTGIRSVIIINRQRPVSSRNVYSVAFGGIQSIRSRIGRFVTCQA